jgi:signal transduction histidine kinase
MRERAEQVKGRIVIESAPGHGTRVEAVVPTA